MWTFLDNFWAVWIEAAPWLFVGLIVAGLVKAWIPANLMKRLLGGKGLGAISRAAIIGTPLPLCSCSVLPAAMQLRRNGASRGSTVSFLISTPENGADSLALSYVLLGPFMTIARPIAAIFSAIFAGWMAERLSPEEEVESKSELKPCCQTPSIEAAEKVRWWQGVYYAFNKLLSDMMVWLTIGIAIAALVQTLVSPDAISRWGQSAWAMPLMLVIGVPMYICATSSTPIAAAMLIAGISPGAVLVFLLTGPATNLAGVLVVQRELGRGALWGYLLGIGGISLCFGWLLNVVVAQWSINIESQLGGHDMLPTWLGTLCAIALISLGIVARVAAAIKERRAAAEAESEPDLISIELTAPEPMNEMLS